MDIIKLFGGGFPLTIQRLQFLQETYSKAVSQLTAFYGLRENEIGVLEGLSLSDGTNGATVNDGIVIYNGEVLEFRAGEAANLNYVLVESSNRVPYNEDLNQDGDLDLKDSDTVRYITTEFAGSSAANGESISVSAITVDYPLNRLPNLQQLIPRVGEIKMWRGSVNNVPQGWQIMSEFNGRFPVGTSPFGFTRYAVGETGGEESVRLNLEQMPKHTHTGRTTRDGDHTHNYTLKRNSNQRFGNGMYDQARGDDQTFETASSGAHTHGLNIDTAGGASFTPEGSSEVHENRPPFFAVYFIEFVGF